ncbi:hypothetical protein ACET3Z_030281 [Daucus carota]
MGTAENFLKASFRILLVVGFLSYIVLAGISESRKFETRTLISCSRQADRSLKQSKLIGEEKYVLHPKRDIHFTSKRRVPNRSDPIHNRRAGNSGKPPGQP